MEVNRMNDTVFLNEKELSAQEVALARESIVAMGKELIERKLVAGSWGNISVKIADCVYAVNSALPHDRHRMIHWYFHCGKARSPDCC